MYRPAEVYRWRFSFSLAKMALLVLGLMGPTWLRAETISGTIQDSSGAVIAGARIEITGRNLVQPIMLSSDSTGKFGSPDLKPATYSVRVTRDGFEPLIKTVDLQGSIPLQITLTISKPNVSISVAGNSLDFANSDPVYRDLRGIGLSQTFRFDNYTLVWDAATFQFQKGTLTFLSPVNGVSTARSLSARDISI